MAVTRAIRSLLIANRGEIAVRIARTARAMGVRTVAVYSDADAGAPHVRICDAAERIGPPPAPQSYLRGPAVIDAALRAGADAVHPGYGFLSENAEFAASCADAGLVWVGPPAAAIRAMGDKIEAKRVAAEAGVPVVPGYAGDDQSHAVLAREAQRIGVPVLVKAAAGGGGKGMRVVSDLAQIGDALDGARREAEAAFGDGRLFLERYLVGPRHIEIQVLADTHGACIALGERECSIQRRHQKVLEEAPSVAVSPALRAEMGDAAVRAARAVGYVNAGTVEFMLDAEGRYFFLEMNTRLQVEHPVTEAVTGVDLVREQIRIAEGAPLAVDAAPPSGHAIEVRVYAEDPENGFLPSVGRITEFSPPQGPGIRNDVGVVAGSVVSMDYDPMLGKLIVFDRTRDDCIERLASALDDYRIAGLASNIGFLQRVVDDEVFRSGGTTTSFIEQRLTGDERPAAGGAATLAAAVAAQSLAPAENGDSWARLGAWRHAAQPRTVVFEEPPCTVDVVRAGTGTWRASGPDGDATVIFDGSAGTLVHGDREERFSAWLGARGIEVRLGGRTRRFRLAAPASADPSHAHRSRGRTLAGAVEAPMSGKIVRVAVHAGDTVTARQVLVVMEAMKMEHTIVAPYDGKVKSVAAAAGAVVGAGDPLVEIEGE